MIVGKKVETHDLQVLLGQRLELGNLKKRRDQINHDRIKKVRTHNLLCSNLPHIHLPSQNPLLLQPIHNTFQNLRVLRPIHWPQLLYPLNHPQRFRSRLSDAREGVNKHARYLFDNLGPDGSDIAKIAVDV